MINPLKPDWDVLFRAARTDPASDDVWSQLYLALWPRLLDWIISRYVLNHQEAEDILQDSLAQYQAKLKAGTFSDPTLQHVLAFVRFSALAHLRKNARLVALDEIGPDPVLQPTGSQHPEHQMLRKLIVDEALERLDQRCAYALRAKYYQGLTSAEIGEALGLNSGAVDTMLHRCRTQCREMVAGLVAKLDR